MSACVIWMDSEHAKIFKISVDGIDKKMMKQHSVDPSGSHHDSHKHNAEEHFFHEIATAVGRVCKAMSRFATDFPWPSYRVVAFFRSP